MGKTTRNIMKRLMAGIGPMKDDKPFNIDDIKPKQSQVKRPYKEKFDGERTRGELEAIILDEFANEFDIGQHINPSKTTGK